MGADESQLLARAQAAVGAAAAAFAADSGIDLEARVGQELADEGLLPAVGDPVVEVLAAYVRAGGTEPLVQADGPAEVDPEVCGDCGRELTPTLVGMRVAWPGSGAPVLETLVDQVCKTPDCLSHGDELAPARPDQQAPAFRTRLAE